MLSSIIEVFNRLNTRRQDDIAASNKALANGPSWRHRRRLIYGAYIVAMAMIIFGAATFFTGSQVGVEMVIGGVSLLAIIVTAYTTSATYEDVRIWKRSGPAELDTEDSFDMDNPDGI